MDTIRADLNYLMERYVNKHECYAHINGKPVIFVYTKGSEDNTEEFMKKWSDAVDGKWYYVLKVFGGYKDMPYQPSSWHQYGPSTRMHKHEDSSRKLVCVNISPGFKHADPNKTTFLERASEELWTGVVKEMIGYEADWQLITSYNEWGEGTSVESALDWQTASGYGMYLDVLHAYSTPEDLTDPDTTVISAGQNLKYMPFSVSNKMLMIEGMADQVTIYSASGRVILKEKNISSLELEFDEPLAILTIELGPKVYHYKYVNFR